MYDSGVAAGISACGARRSTEGLCEPRAGAGECGVIGSGPAPGADSPPRESAVLARSDSHER